MTLIILLGILGAGALALALSQGSQPATGAPPPGLQADLQRLLGSTQDPTIIEQAAALQEAAGRPELAAALRDHARRLRAVAEMARPGGAQRPPGTVDPSGIDWGIPGVPSPSTSSPTQAPAGLDQSIPAVREGIVHPTRLPLLIETARRVDDALRVRNARRNYNRSLVGLFQAMAGLTPDQLYGGKTSAALRYFGIVSPVRAFVSPRTATYTPPENLRSPLPTTPTGRTMDPASWGLQTR